MSEFDITLKQVSFIRASGGRFVSEKGWSSPRDLISIPMSEILEEQFKFLCTEVFSSSDKDIKVHLTHALMWLGFKSIINTTLETASSTFGNAQELRKRPELVAEMRKFIQELPEERREEASRALLGDLDD